MRNKLTFQIAGVLEAKTLPGPIFLELFRYRDADWQLVVTTEMQQKTFLWAPIAIPERLLSSPSHDLQPSQSPLLIRVWAKKSSLPGPNGERQPSTAVLIGECKCVLADIKNPLPPVAAGGNDIPQGLHIVNENELLRNPMNYEHSGLIQFTNVTVTPMSTRGSSMSAPSPTHANTTSSGHGSMKPANSSTTLVPRPPPAGSTSGVSPTNTNAPK
jgi:hypothetical protein